MSPTPLKVLLLEDSKSDALLMAREIRRGGFAVEYRQVQTAVDLISALEATNWDLILSDHSMPTFSAPEALDIVRRQKELDTPFIIVSGTISEDVAVEAMKAGANDYFSKSKLTRLVPAIERELQKAEERRQRHRAEAQLRKTEERFAKAFNASPVAIAISRLSDGKTLSVNPRFAIVFGYEQSDIIGKSPTDLNLWASSEQRQTLVEHLRRFGTLQNEEVTLYKANAEPIYALLSAEVIELDDEPCILSFIQDVTELRRRQEEILEAKKQYARELERRVAERTAELLHQKERVETILRSSNDAILLLERDGNILQANQSFCAIFGWNKKEVAGKRFSDAARVSETSQFQQTLQRVRDERIYQRIELTVHKPNGHPFEVEAALSPVMNNRGKHQEIVCNLRDITARKQIEAELRSALEKEKELNELKSAFTSMISHEFRTPLSIIKVSTEILTNFGDRIDDQKKEEKLHVIDQQIGRLTKLMDDFLLMGRGEKVGFSFEPTHVDLVAACQIVIEEIEMAYHKDRLVDFQYDEACHQGFVDRYLFQHVLQNLLSNAFKYSPSQGTITIRLTCTQEATTLFVKDEGIGMPEEFRKNLFKSFHRAKNVTTIEGTGLGLAITKRAVDTHGGTITVDSAEGKGTSVTVTLPIKYQE